VEHRRHIYKYTFHVVAISTLLKGPWPLVMWLLITCDIQASMLFIYEI